MTFLHTFSDRCIISASTHVRGRESKTKPLPAEPPPQKEYEYGWAEDQFCAWRKLILGKKLRGAPEFSSQPEYDEKADRDSAITCHFADGEVYTVAHVTMASRHLLCSFLMTIYSWY